MLQNDEDGAAWSPPVVTSSATGATEYAGIEEPWMPTLLTERGTVTGQVFDAGDGCQASDFAGAAGKIALVDVVDPFYLGIIDGWSQPCTIGSQTLRAIRAGATAMLSNLISPDDAWAFFRSPRQTLRAIQQEAGDFVVVQVSDIDELADEIRAAVGPTTVTLTPSTPTHGYLRVFSEAASTDADGAEDGRAVRPTHEQPVCRRARRRACRGVGRGHRPGDRHRLCQRHAHRALDHPTARTSTTVKRLIALR